MCDGNAVQRAAVDAAGEFPVALVRLPQRRLAGHGDEGVEFGIQALDLPQRLRHQLPRRHPARTQIRGQTLKIVHVPSVKPS